MVDFLLEGLMPSALSSRSFILVEPDALDQELRQPVLLHAGRLVPERSATSRQTLGVDAVCPVRHETPSAGVRNTADICANTASSSRAAEPGSRAARDAPRVPGALVVRVPLPVLLGRRHRRHRAATVNAVRGRHSVTRIQTSASGRSQAGLASMKRWASPRSPGARWYACSPSKISPLWLTFPT